MQKADWDRTVEEIGPRLFRYFKYRGAQDLASDLTQETLIRLVNRFHLFDSGQGPLIAFTLGIAHNIWLEHQRKHKEHENIEDHNHLASDDSLVDQIVNLDQEQKLKRIVARLPSIQQDILYFYFDAEITTREIGEVLQMPEGTVKSHLHRAKETLRTVLLKELP